MAVTVLATTLGACGSSDSTWIAQRLWSGDVEDLRMADDTNHRLFLVWSSPVEAEGGGVWSAVAEPDGRWSSPARLSSKGSEPRVGAGGGGAMAVWWEPAPPRLLWSRWAPTGWTEAQPLPQADRPSWAELSVDPMGDAMAAWVDRPGLTVATYRLDRGWEPPQVIASTTSNTGVAPVAVAHAGRECATLWRVTTVALVRPLTSVRSLRRIDGAWREAFLGGAGAAGVTFDGSGSVVAASATVPSTLGFVDVGVSAFVGLPAGDWSEERLSAKGLSSLDLARSSTGEVALLHGARSDTAVELLYRPFDGRSFQAADTVHVAAPGATLGPVALGLSDGSAVAAWFAGGRVSAAIKTATTWGVAQPVRTAGGCDTETPGPLAASAAPARMTVVWGERECDAPALWVAHRPRD